MNEKIVPVKEWLENKEADYNEGVGLLSKFSKNRMLIQSLSRKEWREKLVYELTKILRVTTNPQSVAAFKERNKEMEDAGEAIVNATALGVGVDRLLVMKEGKALLHEELPEELQPLHAYNLIAYKKARTLHEKLKLMVDKTDEERAPIVEDLNAIMDQIRENWDAIDAWLNDGTLPELKKGVVITGDKIDQKTVNAYRSYISKNKKALASDEKDKYLDKVQERVTALLKSGEPMGDDLLKELSDLGINVKAD